MDQAFEKNKFLKEVIWMVNKYMKKSSIALIIRATQVRTTVNYRLTLVRRAKSKKQKTNIGECGGIGILAYCRRECEMEQSP